MKILCGCEFSQIVTKEFRKKGHEAYSCDIIDCTGGHPEWHIKGDILEQLDKDWDLIIAFPPCTHLCVSGNRWHSETQARIDAAQFVWKIWNCKCKKVAIENPVGVINSLLPNIPKPYYIQPWQFGHKETKKTGLWTRGLPKLQPTNVVGPPPKNMTPEEKRTWNRIHYMSPGKDRGHLRSITYEGIAKAFASQWG